MESASSPMNSTTAIEPVLWARHPGISRGREILYGHRLERRFIRYLRERFGVWWVAEQYGLREADVRAA